MESINPHKGYDIVEFAPAEKLQTTPHHPLKTAIHKRFNRTTVISLTILLTLLIASLIAVLVHHSLSEERHESSNYSPSSSSPNSAKPLPSNSSSSSPNSAKPLPSNSSSSSPNPANSAPTPAPLSVNFTSLKTICNVTLYPDSCFTSLSSTLNSSAYLKSSTQNSLSNIDPEFIFSVSLNISLQAVTNLTSWPNTVLKHNTNHSTEMAFKDCASLFDDAVSQLNKSLAYVNVGPGEKALTESKMEDLNIWISAAETDQQTCLDGLQQKGATVDNELTVQVENSKEYMSNSLAILVNIPNLLREFGLTMH